MHGGFESQRQQPPRVLTVRSATEAALTMELEAVPTETSPGAKAFRGKQRRETKLQDRSSAPRRVPAVDPTMRRLMASGPEGSTPVRKQKGEE